MMFQILLALAIFAIVGHSEYNAAAVPNSEDVLNIWQLEMFVESGIQSWVDEVAPTMDPIKDLVGLTLNMTFPSYLVLNGDIWNLTFEGVIQLKITEVTVDSQRIIIKTSFDAALLGSHNLNGTIELNSGKIVPIGGGQERQLKLSIIPATFHMQIRYEVNADGYVRMSNAEVLYLELMPYSENGEWTMDLGGLLDPIPPEEAALLDNALHWITIEITERKAVDSQIEDILEESMLGFLQSKFDKTSYDDIISNPPSTPPPPPPAPSRIEIHVQPPHGTMRLNCKSDDWPGEQGPVDFTSEGGTLAWEWYDVESKYTTWVCWAYWGEAVLLRYVEFGGIRIPQGFNAYGSNFVETIPRKNNTWLIDGSGKARIEENGVPVNDHRSSWDGVKPLP